MTANESETVTAHEIFNKNSFDRMFDYNRDGHLDMFEQAMQYEFLEEGIRNSAGDVGVSDSFNEDVFDYMDEDERREALEEAGWIQTNMTIIRE